MTEDRCLLFSKKYGYMTFINLWAGGEIEKCVPFSDASVFFPDTSLFCPTRRSLSRRVAFFARHVAFFPGGFEFTKIKIDLLTGC